MTKTGVDTIFWNLQVNSTRIKLYFLVQCTLTLYSLTTSKKTKKLFTVYKYSAMRNFTYSYKYNSLPWTVILHTWTRPLIKQRCRLPSLQPVCSHLTFLFCFISDEGTGVQILTQTLIHVSLVCVCVCVFLRWTGGADGAQLSRILQRSCGFTAHIML